MSQSRHPGLHNEQGTALVTALLFLVIIAMMAATAVNSGVFEVQHTTNFKAHREATYIADAGIEDARAALGLQLSGGTNLSQLLLNSCGSDITLVDSNIASNFDSTNDVPFMQKTFGGGSYKVYLTNDVVDGIQNKTDNNRKVTLTSVGVAPGGKHAITQSEVEAPSPPAGISLVGNLISFTSGSGNVTYSGGSSKPAIAVNTVGSYATVVSAIPNNKKDNFTGGGITTPSVLNTEIKPPWDMASLQGLFTIVKGIADYTSPSDSGFSLGTNAQPKVVVLENDYTPTSNGCGILAVKGRLSIPNGFNYTGLVIVIGKGELVATSSGGGNRNITGGLVVANTEGGTSIFDVGGGGGNLSVTYNDEAIFKKLSLPLKKVSWRRLY